MGSNSFYVMCALNLLFNEHTAMSLYSMFVYHHVCYFVLPGSKSGLSEEQMDLDGIYNKSEPSSPSTMTTIESEMS